WPASICEQACGPRRAENSCPGWWTPVSRPWPGKDEEPAERLARLVTIGRRLAAYERRQNRLKLVRFKLTRSGRMDHRERLMEASQDEAGSQADAAGDVAAVCAAVIEEMRAGRLLDAQIRCRRAIETAPDDPELLHLMALVCFNAKELDHAVEWASRAIRSAP